MSGINETKSNLEDLGWSDFFARQLVPLEGGIPSFVARVTGEERGFYRVQLTLDHWHWAEVSGKLRHDASRRRDFAAVGDWVVCTGDLSNEKARFTIHRILERKTLLARKMAGSEDRVDNEQVLAANVDTAFVMTSLNMDLNLRRLDRYLTLIYDAGAVPVVLLTKADLAGAEVAAARTADILARSAGLAIHAISVRANQGLAALDPYLTAGRTVVLLGSSGAGKSTLANRLLGKEIQRTQEIREHDQRGRHTTTSRSLLPLITGAMLIDTPGMREIQMLDQEEGLHELYPDVHQLILHCKFSNCAHANEPGCAVRGALESGGLTPERWTAYLKLEAEIAAVERKKIDPASPGKNQDRSRQRKQERKVRDNVKQKRWDRT